MAEAVDFATTAAARAAVDDSKPAADGADQADDEVPDAAPAGDQAQQAEVNPTTEARVTTEERMET
jgi:hypothetical protein